MSQHLYWETGTKIVYWEVWRGQVWTAMPVTVVQDTPDLIVLYLCAGTRWKLPEGEDFLGLLQVGDWQLRDIVTAGSCLYLIPPGEAYAVRTMGGLGRQEIAGWYVNLQEPVRRTALGFDFMDHALDVVVAPDLSEWRWHDEDELREAQEMGLFSVRLVRQIRATGERIVEQIKTKSFSVINGWDKWLPPPEWPIPDLSADWEEV
jgi:hypothetical protein